MNPGSDSRIQIQSSSLCAQIDPLGAQLWALQDESGRDLLWNGDPAVWSGRAPLLFPIVGALAGGVYRYADRTFPLPRHGFARVSEFQLLRQESAHAEFLLGSSPDTRSVYPFEFELLVAYTLRDSTLETRVTVRNTGGKNLPASFGFHPAFRWPLPYGHARAEHHLTFSDTEPAHVRRLDGQGLLTPAIHPIPLESRRLPLRDALFEHDALIFDAIRSRTVRFGADAGPGIEVNLFDAPYLGLWSKPGAGFMCIEPWHGLADPQGFSGDFSGKPGVFEVAPGQARTLAMDITLR